MHRRKFLTVAAGGLGCTIAGCIGGVGDDERADIHGEMLRITTTTSTYDTGLLEDINAAFSDRFGSTVEAISQGTGAALETARNGDADLVLVHARPHEDDFLRDGYGINRRTLMFNDFVIVGPESDEAGIDGMEDAIEAFRQIAESEAVFVSRGDNSGTYMKEKEMWDAANVEPAGDWYREAGSGMGEVLTQASLSSGYTLADRGTYLSQRSELDGSIRVQGPVAGGSELLENPYGIIAVNPAIHEHVEYDLAMAYIGFFTSRAGQSIIEEYDIDGEQLFFPQAVAEDPRFEQYVPSDWDRTAD